MFKSQEQVNKLVEILKEAGYSRAKCEDYTDWTFFHVEGNKELKFAGISLNLKGFEISATGMRIWSVDDAEKYGKELLFLADVLKKLNEVMAE